VGPACRGDIIARSAVHRPRGRDAPQEGHASARAATARQRAACDRPAGQARYDAFWEEQLADPEFRRVYAEEAAKKELWLQLVEARQAAGLTQTQMAERLGVSQSQVAKVERHGYEAYTLTTLRRYVRALGEDFALEVQVRHIPHAEHVAEAVATD